MGLIAALIAVLLATRGPPFRWRGASILLVAAVVIGFAATALAARDARTLGYGFDYTPASIAAALGMQCAFMLTFYGTAFAVRLLVLRIAARPLPSVASDE